MRDDEQQLPDEDVPEQEELAEKLEENRWTVPDPDEPPSDDDFE
jgi:hypothetical protein